ncbi:MAG: recombination protein RecR [Candidatus Nealsonbacteria bacterium RIFCSPHIGHO2_01_FULL_38_55]|uniref:Recombination protein RecR n=2 Tax=Candidatus Nealsoniibacteriota TaxID=1817911 RepID=A0A1G2EG15_9BACT|nr:MAG: Recombination protein RecR [Parcubacteria group bacterium GW2011_GWC2_39_11]OGZ19650.1 MAG: recombination protein RecR [Candidatus Nealsonbacteria bacterium RIFCSPHIGHO2_01_FULL_38_55]OGZ21194.1 MAG: recombination protein RecR [Candidatus Nealsonbacteria bacterium RIFCSPHIGHO2_02_FULL_38_75]OGZ23137.1 MAG: recombination protein RecR [Candidatus Nealsonbacteria bacterium RIFCSPHIGHO2_12_FULL_38_18]OGZ23597.1 MAG: recombination protein RecR [Candidatus Nealsonbacteria bacterium RIFCSPLOWO
MFSPAIQKLISLFSKFPAVGPRAASRFVFYLIGLPQEKFNELINSLADLKNKIKICSFCFNPFENKMGNEQCLCPICQNPSRNKNMLCVVEKENDLISIEKSGKYNGLYFILGGIILGLKEEELKKIRIAELEERIKNPKKYEPKATIKEIILATNPIPEGEATALLIERRIKSLQPESGVEIPKITRLGRGLPTGGELEYADDETLSGALEGRK